MAAFKLCKDVNDIALKPRLLRSLIHDTLPDQTHPFRDPPQLSSIVSLLKIHKLLTEQASPSTNDDKLANDWASSVKSWVDRVLLLARCDLPDKCWAGVCLLGVTCAESSSARFLDSYSEWFNVLQSHIQTSGASQFVKVASCAAMSDLLVRLGGFLNLKKEGNSHAGKLVQPVLKMLNEDVTEAVLDVAAHLLLTILNYFPFSIHRHHDNAEGVIVSKIMSGNCSANVLKKLSCCLALLPKSKGDEDSWTLMMQKILLSTSTLLNSTLEGLEEESRRGEAVSLLIPPGSDPPPILGGKTMTGGSSNTGERSQESLLSSISSLMQCCCLMLTNSYPVQVPVPVHPLLAIIRRVLMVNGSLPETLKSFTTAMQQEFVCLHLPALHLSMLEVLAAVVKALRSQLLPHAAAVVRLLLKYFETCQLPQLRMKAYSIIKDLLISMGAGLALYISEEVINKASVDLKFAESNYDGAPLDVQSYEHRHKKRKHGTVTGLSVGQQATLCSESKECHSSIALKIAAIETLEALLVMGGALRCDSSRRSFGDLRCDSWRKTIDKLLIEVATNAFKGEGNHDSIYRKETKIAWEDFQLVALRALLASLLSPAGYRPPYLSKGLELFQKGKQNSGSKVTEFCVQALLSLEVLVHPRALPLIDTPLPHGTGFIDPKNKLPQRNGIVHDVYDFLRDKYIEDGTVSEVPTNILSRDVQFVEKSNGGTSKDQNDNETNVVNALHVEMMPKGRDESSKSGMFDNKIESTDGSREMMDVDLQEKPKTAVGPVSCVEDALNLSMSNYVLATKGLQNNASDAIPSDLQSGTFLSSQSTEGIDSTAGLETVTTSHTSRMSMIEEDDESADSFPDIVDADPDSDSE